LSSLTFQASRRSKVKIVQPYQGINVIGLRKDQYTERVRITTE
jgi:hypothetical protein